MTEDEKKRLLAGFVKAKPEPEGEPEDPWTDAEMLKAAHRIAERLGIREPFADKPS